MVCFLHRETLHYSDSATFEQVFGASKNYGAICITFRHLAGLGEIISAYYLDLFIHVHSAVYQSLIISADKLNGLIWPWFQVLVGQKCGNAKFYKRTMSSSVRELFQILWFKAGYSLQKAQTLLRVFTYPTQWVHNKLENFLQAQLVTIGLLSITQNAVTCEKFTETNNFKLLNYIVDIQNKNLSSNFIH